MTHVEYLEYLIKEYQKDFNEYPCVDEETISFRQGMIFAWRLAINGLKRGDFNETET